MITSVKQKLTVVPDQTTPGSQGRLCLQLPVPSRCYPETVVSGRAQPITDFHLMSDDLWIGSRWSVLGTLLEDRALLLVRQPEGSPSGKVVSPRSQIWWKNGVRDHGIRQNWWVTVYILDLDLIVVRLHEVTDDPIPDLPPMQPTLWGG